MKPPGYYLKSMLCVTVLVFCSVPTHAMPLPCDPGTIALDAGRNALITVRIPALSRTFLLFSAMPVSE